MFNSIISPKTLLFHQGKYGKHIYSLEDFRIDEKYIDNQTKAYQAFQKKI